MFLAWKLQVLQFSGHHQTSLPGGPNMNKFEQVFSDHHQMSLAGAAAMGSQV